jgi:thiol:disulfide interchange protein DsbC
MHIFICCLILTFLLCPVSNSSAFPTKGQDCSKCHTLKKDEALGILKTFDPNVKVLNVTMGSAKYLFEVSIESNGKKQLVYIDLPKKHVISGSLIQIQGRKNLTQERLSEINRINVSQIPLGDALVLGNKNAKHRVIVFDDPECPFCAKLHQEMKKVVSERKDIAFYIKMFPLKMHASAYQKAKAIVCEKSLSMLEDSLAKKELPAPKCNTTAVDDNIKLANKLGITGAPTLIMPDGRVVPGFRDADSLKALILKK